MGLDQICSGVERLIALHVLYMFDFGFFLGRTLADLYISKSIGQICEIKLDLDNSFLEIKDVNPNA